MEIFEMKVEEIDAIEEIEEPTVLVCGICGEEHNPAECSLIKTSYHVKDRTVMSKARLSLPECLSIVTLTGGTCAIKTIDSIKEGTRFGPLEARKVFSLASQVQFPIKVSDKDEFFRGYYLDTSNEYECNWMCFVEQATFLEEQNLICYEEDSQIYFLSTKDITEGEYLKVWYAPHYARQMSKHLLEPLKIDIIEDDLNVEHCLDVNKVVKKQNFVDRETWICKFCGTQRDNLPDFAQHISEHYSMQLQKLCEFCFKGFHNRKFLKKHINVVHFNEKYANNIAIEKSKPKNAAALAAAASAASKNTTVPDSGSTTATTSTAEDCVTGVSQAPGGPLLNVVGSTEDLSIPKVELECPNIIMEDTGADFSADTSSMLQENESINFQITPTDDRLVCDICLKTFTRLKQLVTHLVLHTGKFICSTCETAFSRKEYLNNHKCSIPVERNEHCPHCDQKFFLKKSLTRHIAIKHTGAFICQKICQISFPSQKILDEHKCEQEKISVACPTCSKEFTNQKNLRRHMRLHLENASALQNQDNGYLCDVCSKKFTNKKVFAQHVRSHQEPLYSCNMCNKKFIRNSYYMEHLESHKESWQAAYACGMCDEKFTSKRYLSTHVTHMHNPKRYQCPQCALHFRQKSNLEVHINRRHRRQCLDCDEVFDSAEKLKKHTVVHYDMCYECPACAHVVKLKSSLHRHFKNKHPDDHFDMSRVRCVDKNARNNVESNANSQSGDNNNMSDFSRSNDMDTMFTNDEGNSSNAALGGNGTRASGELDEFEDDEDDDMEDMEDQEHSRDNRRMREIEQNLDLIANDYDANNMIHRTATVTTITRLQDDQQLDEFSELTESNKRIQNEHVLDFNTLEMEFEKNFDYGSNDLGYNSGKDVCLSMPELGDMDQNVSLGRSLGDSALILENGAIVEPLHEDVEQKVVLYILNKEGSVN